MTHPAQPRDSLATRLPVTREDGELLGFLTSDGEAWAACTVFGRPVSVPLHRDDAEALLRSQGLHYLTERWELREDRAWITVTIVEASPDRVTVRFADYGHPQIFGTRRTLDAPVGSILRREGGKLDPR